jgi:hypothetical protein
MIEQVLVSRVLSVMPDQDTFWVKGAAMKRNFVVVCAVLLLSLVAFGQERGEAPKAEIFGGYQYFHANSGVSGLSGFNLNGWNASASGFFSRNLGVTADFSGSYGTPSVLGVGVKTNFYTFLFGPTVRVAANAVCSCSVWWWADFRLGIWRVGVVNRLHLGSWRRCGCESQPQFRDPPGAGRFPANAGCRVEPEQLPLLDWNRFEILVVKL